MLSGSFSLRCVGGLLARPVGSEDVAGQQVASCRCSPRTAGRGRSRWRRRRPAAGRRVTASHLTVRRILGWPCGAESLASEPPSEGERCVIEFLRGGGEPSGYGQVRSGSEPPRGRTPRRGREPQTAVTRSVFQRGTQRTGSGFRTHTTLAPTASGASHSRTRASRPRVRSERGHPVGRRSARGRPPAARRGPPSRSTDRTGPTTWSGMARTSTV